MGVAVIEAVLLQIERGLFYVLASGVFSAFKLDIDILSHVMPWKGPFHQRKQVVVEGQNKYLPKG